MQFHVDCECGNRIDVATGEAGSEKIIFGTDTPWFNHHNYIGALLGAEMSDDDRRNILYRNAQRLLGEVPAGDSSAQAGVPTALAQTSTAEFSSGGMKSSHVDPLPTILPFSS